MAESDGAARLLPRKRPNFAGRSAQVADPGFGSMNPSNTTSREHNPAIEGGLNQLGDHCGPFASSSPASARRDGLAWGAFGGVFQGKERSHSQGLEVDKEQSRRPGGIILRRTSLGVPRNLAFLDKKAKGDQILNGSDSSEKLGTFSGVFVPTTLNVLSILMFLRFGFILGQSGVLGMMGKNFTLLLTGYLIY